MKICQNESGIASTVEWLTPKVGLEGVEDTTVNGSWGMDN